MSTPYRSDYEPPFPVLTIFLRDEDEQLGPFPALLDSGADTTLIPTRPLEQVGAAESEQVRIRSHFGEYQEAQLYLVSIQINGLFLPGLYVVGDDVGNEIILGRNILNKLPLFLDGPKGQTEVLDDAIVQRLRVRREG